MSLNLSPLFNYKEQGDYCIVHVSNLHYLHMHAIYILHQEEEQKRLELEMEKRRKRIEEWRAERKKKAELLPVNFALPSKKWTLEDDDEDDEEEPSQKLGENEEDALDAFMQVNYMHINLSVNWIIVMFINCFSFG